MVVQTPIRRLLVIALCAGVLLLYMHETSPRTILTSSNDYPKFEDSPESNITRDALTYNSPPPSPVSYPHDPILFLQGPPTAEFRDNLRPEVQYITTWIPGGFTNDVMSLANLLYVAMNSDRIPIMPEFGGFRGEWQAGFISFGEVFDIPRISAALGVPILEWNQVKEYRVETPKTDPLGCWSLWAPYSGDDRPRDNFFTGNSRASLDLSYTVIMEPVKLIGMNEPHEPHVNLNKLVRLSDREGYDEAMKTHKPEAFPPWFPNVYPPDFQLMCMDMLYWAAVVHPYEWGTGFSPGWKIARHFKWAPKLQSLAREYLGRLLGVSPMDPIPPFITIHARRRDFKMWCEGVPLGDCFPSLDTFEVRVREIRAELDAKLQLNGQGSFKVIVTSDESDPEWWQQVHRRGWLSVDHSPAGEDTEAKHGVWYSALIDIVIPSMGMGFVGTEASTMSLLSRRRVEDWNGGVTRMVKWGRPGADDH